MNSSNQAFPIPVANIPPGYCYDPTDLIATVENDLVTFKWKSPHDNDGFYLILTNSEGSTQHTVFGVGIQLKLLPQTNYTWSVRTMCDRLAPRGSATVIGLPFTTGDPTYECPVIDITGALILQTSKAVRLQWSAVSGAIGYKLEIKSGSTILTFHPYTNYITLNVLNPNSEYIWRVAPECNLNPGTFSDWGAFNTTAAINCPAITIKSFLSATTALITWSNAAKSYQVYKDGSLLSLELPTNIFCLKNLSPGVEYNITVIPNCDDGPGDMASISFTTLKYLVENPTDVVASINESNKLHIQWTPAIDISSQELIINGSKIELDAETTSFIKDDVNSDTKYNILVRSVKGQDKSIGSFLQTVPKIFCSASLSIATVSKNHNSLSLAWRAVPGARTYGIRYTVSNLNEWVILTTYDNQVTIPGLIPATSYLIEIVAKCNSGVSQILPYLEQTLPVPQCPLAYQLYATDILPTQFNLTFKLSNDKLEGIFDVSVTQGVNPPTHFYGTQSGILITGLTQNLPYVVTVTNNCSSNPSVSAPYTVITPKVCSAPTGATAQLITNNTVLSASWGAVAGVTGYGIRYKKIGAINWSTLPDQVGVAFTTAAESALYMVEITSLFPDGRKCPVIVITDVPKVLNLKNDNISPKTPIAWTPIEGASYYNVKVFSIKEEYEFQSITAFINPFLQQLTSYSVVVNAVYGNLTGPDSDSLLFTTNGDVSEDIDCSGPAVLAYFQDSHKIDEDIPEDTKIDISVYITDYMPAHAYRVDIYADTTAIPVATVNIATGIEDQEGIAIFKAVPKPADIYVAKVTRYNTEDDGTCVTMVDVKSTTCATPENLVAIDENSNSITLQWDTTNAPQYEVYKDNEFVALVSDLSYVVEGLDPDKNYTFKVKSKCSAALYSPFSDDLITSTDPEPYTGELAIGNNSLASSITDITPIFYELNDPLPIGPGGDDLIGVHGAQTHFIITIVGSAPQLLVSVAGEITYFDVVPGENTIEINIPKDAALNIVLREAV